MGQEKDALCKTVGVAEDERTRSILGKINSKIDTARHQPANELSSDALRLAGIRNEADRALAIDRDKKATYIEGLLDTISDSVSKEQGDEIKKEIRRLRK